MSSFGEVMRRERELREITLREIAEATKINLRYLEALERNDFGRLPGGVFNKGFVRAYAQFIGVDPESMVTAYLEEEQRQSAAEQARRERSRGAPAPAGRAARRGGARSEPDPKRLWAAVAIVAAAVLVAVILVVLAILQGRGASPEGGDDPASAVHDARGARGS